MTRGMPLTRPAPQASKVRGPSINQLWLRACADTGAEPGNATEATRQRYRELLRHNGITAERTNG